LSLLIHPSKLIHHLLVSLLVLLFHLPVFLCLSLLLFSLLRLKNELLIFLGLFPLLQDSTYNQFLNDFSFSQISEWLLNNVDLCPVFYVTLGKISEGEMRKSDVFYRFCLQGPSFVPIYRSGQS
jgi:hypothetical protein